ncbi:hypothetical protein DFH08DRAFT_805027 [Mycena albidolilacea]|uniref:Uncharacterized protein n=1 Tax=Mycena albidolilacea TaxID=1033008 RepID=A0AAD7AB95_9AGAR|nr:hypothetical protein DFH08DRAFT_805027 [Mycena albidolilacea]
MCGSHTPWSMGYNGGGRLSRWPPASNLVSAASTDSEEGIRNDPSAPLQGAAGASNTPPPYVETTPQRQSFCGGTKVATSTSTAALPPPLPTQQLLQSGARARRGEQDEAACSDSQAAKSLRSRRPPTLVWVASLPEAAWAACHASMEAPGWRITGTGDSGNETK